MTGREVTEAPRKPSQGIAKVQDGTCVTTVNPSLWQTSLINHGTAKARCNLTTCQHRNLVTEIGTGDKLRYHPQLTPLLGPGPH